MNQEAATPIKGISKLLLKDINPLGDTREDSKFEQIKCADIVHNFPSKMNNHPRFTTVKRLASVGNSLITNSPYFAVVSFNQLVGGSNPPRPTKYKGLQKCSPFVL